MKFPKSKSRMLSFYLIVHFLVDCRNSYYVLGFVAAHTLPVLYERYEDQVDNFVYKVLDQMQHHYRRLDAGVLSKIPKGRFKGKKHE